MTTFENMFATLNFSDAAFRNIVLSIQKLEAFKNLAIAAIETTSWMMLDGWYKVRSGGFSPFPVRAIVKSF